MPAAAALRRPSALRTPVDDPPADVPAPRAVASELLLHRLVRRELRLLAELSAWASADDAERTRELTRHADLLGRLLLHHHATERELVWPALLRAAPPARPQVARWTVRVAGLDDRLRDLSTAARQWAVACSDKARDAFTLACLDLADAVEEQTAEEERDLLPLLAAHLSPAAWAEVPRAARLPAVTAASARWCSACPRGRLRRATGPVARRAARSRPGWPGGWPAAPVPRRPSCGCGRTARPLRESRRRPRPPPPRELGGGRDGASGRRAAQ
jgi:hypothetical protein